ncbi:MAG: uroporphyrinogen-III synthase [Polyangia bacterium]|jgi:uroporphyrinogen-III synthase|nr:uroporphyrinogen-III synthase [Polyangia bacterium]
MTGEHPSTPFGSEKHRQPLVALTRSEEDNLGLGALLQEKGLRWVSVPSVALVDTRPEEAALEELRTKGPFAAVAFPSRRAVAALIDPPGLLAALDIRPDGLLVAAVGPGTAQALRERGWPVALEPGEKTGAALAAALGEALPAGVRVLLPGGDRARPELGEGLVSRGLVPYALQVYAHAAPPEAPPLAERPDAVVCASPSAAESFLAARPELRACAFVAIGPTTEAALEALGVHRVIRALSPTNAALADAVFEALEPARQAPAPSTGHGSKGEAP